MKIRRSSPQRLGLEPLRFCCIALSERWSKGSRKSQPEPAAADSVLAASERKVETTFVCGAEFWVRIQDAIRKTEKSVVAMQYCKDELEACPALAQAICRGVEVRITLDSLQQKSLSCRKQAERVQELAEWGVQLRGSSWWRVLSHA